MGNSNSSDCSGSLSFFVICTYYLIKLSQFWQSSDNVIEMNQYFQSNDHFDAWQFSCFFFIAHSNKHSMQRTVFSKYVFFHWFLNPFLANVPILYTLKTPENLIERT